MGPLPGAPVITLLREGVSIAASCFPLSQNCPFSHCSSPIPSVSPNPKSISSSSQHSHHSSPLHVHFYQLYCWRPAPSLVLICTKRSTPCQLKWTLWRSSAYRRYFDAYLPHSMCSINIGSLAQQCLIRCSSLWNKDLFMIHFSMKNSALYEYKGFLLFLL